MDKKVKAEVSYRNGHGDKLCMNCTMYNEPGRSCSAVQGYIAKLALCDLFKKKRGT
jgi:hypothetical protein